MATFDFRAAKTVLWIGALLSLALLTSARASSQELEESAAVLVKNGIISAQTDVAKYRFSGPITRAEMAKIIFGFYNVFNSKNISFNECTGKTFSDVGPKIDLCKYIEALSANQVIALQEKFRPNDNLNRAEMVTMLLKAISVSPSDVDAGFSDVTPALGAHYGYINAAANLHIISSAKTFRPLVSATRWEVFILIARILQGDIR